MSPMAKNKFKISPTVKPEIRAFVLRADALAKQKNLSRFTMSRRLFGETQGRTLDNLAEGKGANVIGWIEANKRLSEMEDETLPQALSA